MVSLNPLSPSVRRVLQTQPRKLSCTSFLIHYLPIIQSFDAYNSAYHVSVFSVFQLKQKQTSTHATN